MSRPDWCPDDVWDFAEIALKFVPAGDDEAQIASVARAILAERERCAEIADMGHYEHRTEGGHLAGRSYAVWCGRSGPQIAARIREGR